MEAALKTIAKQVQAMRRRWPGFDVAEETRDKVVWFGSLFWVLWHLLACD